jgi:hypothetical protein
MNNQIIPFGDMERMAGAIAKSGLFGMKTPDQAIALMIVAQAEGRHPGTVAREYHIISGRPALRSDAMLARFQQSGGSIQWGERTDKAVSGTFSHPQGGELTLTWTIEDAKRAGIYANQWMKYPRQMLTARVISEGVRAVFPAVVAGVYTPEEVQDFDPPVRTSQPSTPSPFRAVRSLEKVTEVAVEVSTKSNEPIAALPAPVKPDFTYEEKPNDDLKELTTLMELSGVTDAVVMAFVNRKGANPKNVEYIPELEPKIIKGLVKKWDDIIGSQKEAA